MALAWCAMARPTVLRRAESAFAKFIQPAGLWRSALAALSGPLKDLAAACVAFARLPPDMPTISGYGVPRLADRLW